MLTLNQAAGRWPTVLLFSLLLGGLLAGCVSTKERYERARSHESEGEYAEAAFDYVRVLEREPEFSDARERLSETGARAIETWMEQARAADRDGRPEDALRHLEAIGRLHASSRDVGVTLSLPDNYASLQDGLRERAADAALADANRLADAGQYEEALDAFEQARRYVDAPDRLDRIDEQQADVLLVWADEAMQQRRFQTAHRRVEAVYGLVGEDHAFAREARALQRTAVERGTRRVAFLPFWRTESAAEEMVPAVLQDLNDILYTRHWAEPPPFIASADAVSLRRILRRQGLNRTTLSTNDAASVGRTAEAEFVVTGSVTDFTVAKDDVDEERVRTSYSTRRGLIDTVYTRRTYDLEVEAVVDYRIVDVRSGRTVEGSTARAGVDGEIVEGVFDGDWRDLDLSGAEKDLFDPRVRRQRRAELEGQLVDRMAADLSESVFERLLDQIE